MDFKVTLMQSIKDAMKARDSVRLNTLRFLLSEIKNVEIDEGEQSEEQIHKLIARQVKQMKETLEEYKKAGKDDVVAEEMQKMAILEEYLPKQMSDEALEALVAEVVASSEDKNMGKIIGQVVAKAAGQADGSRISSVVKAALQ